MKSTKRVFVVVLALVLTVALAAIPASAQTMASASNHGTIPGPEGGPDIDWTTYLYAATDSATATATASRNTIVYATVDAFILGDGHVFHNVAHDLVSGTSASASVNNIPQEDPSLGHLPIFLAQGDYIINTTSTEKLEVYV